MAITCLIIDDEPLAINVIKNFLEQVNDIEVSETFSNAIDGFNYLKTNKVDLIFLDINMPLLDGINFIKSLENKPMIIITSAYEQYAVETYELDVLDYLVKPIALSRFIKATNKAFKQKNAKKDIIVNDRPFLFVKIDTKKMKKVFLDEILVIESLKDYLKITTQTNNYITHSTLSNFTDQLPSNKFLRIHRSYTVAIDKIDSLEGNSLEIEGVRYIIGRTYADRVKSKILDNSL